MVEPKGGAREDCRRFIPRHRGDWTLRDAVMFEHAMVISTLEEKKIRRWIRVVGLPLQRQLERRREQSLVES